MARYGNNGTSNDGDVVDGTAIEVSSSAGVPVARPAGRLQKHQSGGAVVKTAAAATAGGLAVGAASVALARIAREAARPLPGLARRRKSDIESSQSILIDIHVLKARK